MPALRPPSRPRQRRFPYGLLALSLLGLLALALPLRASAVLHFELADLVEHSGVVVDATVKSEACAWENGARNWTTYTLEVHETLKGEFGASGARCHARGGVVGNRGQVASGQPYLELNQRYLLFLEQDAAGDRYLFCGLSQGVFPVKEQTAEGEDAEPELRASNGFQGVRLVNRNGQEIEAEKLSPIEGTLADLKQRVAALLAPAGGEAEPDAGGLNPTGGEAGAERETGTPAPTGEAGEDAEKDAGEDAEKDADPEQPALDPRGTGSDSHQPATPSAPGGAGEGGAE